MPQVGMRFDINVNMNTGMNINVNRNIHVNISSNININMNTSSNMNINMNISSNMNININMVQHLPHLSGFLLFAHNLFVFCFLTVRLVVVFLVFFLSSLQLFEVETAKERPTDKQKRGRNRLFFLPPLEVGTAKERSTDKKNRWNRLYSPTTWGRNSQRKANRQKEKRTNRCFAWQS